MIFTASYFETGNHHGRLIAGSQSVPKGFESLEKLAPVVPSWQLVNYWKNSINRHRLGKISNAVLAEDWESYQRDYWHQLDSNKEELFKYIEQLEGDITVLCWEKSDAVYPQCHRRLFGEFVDTYYPKLWGGNDVWYNFGANDNSKYLPVLLEMVKTLTKRGVAVGFSEDQDGFFYLSINGSELDGVFTAPILINILSNLIKPVQPLKWFVYYKIEKFHPNYKDLW